MKKLLLAVFLIAGCGQNNPFNPPAPKPPQHPGVVIGSPGLEDMGYSWSPADSLDDASKPQPKASPKHSTLYTLSVKSKCGVATSQVNVKVFKPDADGVLQEIKE
jgi:hypothetical protein